jgi:hypothetical protein
MAEECNRLLVNHVLTNGVFMTKQLRESFLTIAKEIRLGMCEYISGSDARDSDLELEGRKRVSTIEGKIAEAEESVQDRLGYARA